MNKGFSLIELVVVLGILSVLIGASLVALVPFGEKRNVLDDSRTLATEIRQVVNKATAVEVPDGCIGLNNYLIEFDVGGDEEFIRVTAECDVGSEVKMIEVFRHASFYYSIGTFPTPMIIKVPEGTTTEQKIEVCGSGHLYYLEVGASGVVSGPEYDSEGC